MALHQIYYSCKNCSAHPDEKELVVSDGKIKAVVLPPNVTFLQPIDQEVPDSVKLRHGRKLVEDVNLRTMKVC